MSEFTPRIYQPSVRYRQVERVRRKHRGCAALIVAPILVVAAVFYCLWTTRDTYPAARLIPREQGFRVFAGDLLNKRGKIAASQVWQALPESWGLEALRKQLNQDLDLPEWVLNNLVGPVCYICGNDLQRFSDMLFATKMRRIGCLVERLHWIGDSIEEDWAGGLHLRRIKDLGVYYAVRGRTLVLSTSRDALVRALTLREEDALEPDALAEAVEAFGAEDLHGTLTFGDAQTEQPSETEPLSALGRAGEVFASISFAVRVEPAEMRVQCRALLRPAWNERLAKLLTDVRPQDLRSPLHGMLGISANFGKPIQEVWTDICALLEAPPSWEQVWSDWTQPSDQGDDAAEALAKFTTFVIGSAGPGARLSWCGVDLNEMLPVPELAATFDARPDDIAALFASLPPPPPDAKPWDSFPRYDAEKQRVCLPMPGGRSIEPTAVLRNGELLMSTSGNAADRLLAEPVEEATLDRRGNLYVTINPYASVCAVHDVAALLAENGLLEGYTPASLEETLAPWLTRAQRLQSISAIAGHEAGELTGEFTLVCAPE